MPNTIKYSTGSETNALNKGNWYIGTGDVDKGTTDITGYYIGISPPISGYTIYITKPDNTPSIYVANNDQELIFLTNQISYSGFTTVGQCLNYFASQDDKMVFNRDYEEIVTNGLILNLDAGFLPSYPQSGNTWYDLSKSNNNGTISDSPIYSGDTFIFDGQDNKVDLTDITLTSAFTINFHIKYTDILNDENKRSLLELDGTFSNIELNTNKILSINNLNSGTTHFDIGNLIEDSFYLISIVRDGSNFIKTYINGVLTDTSVNEISSSIIIKRIFSTKNLRNFKGGVNHISIYNKELDQTKITEIYNRLSPIYGTSSNTLNDNLTSDIQKFKSLIRENYHIFEAESDLYDEINHLDSLGLYDQAKLILTANGVGEGRVYAIKPYGYIADFTRGSYNTRTNSQGYIERNTFNLIPFSKNFLPYNKNGFWESYRVVLDSNTTETLAPDGTYSALKITDTADYGAHRIRKGTFIPDGGTYYISFYAKKAELDYVHFATDSYIGSGAFFDLNLGQTGFITGERNVTDGYTNTYGSSIKYYGDGWYKCSLYFSLQLGFSGANGFRLPGEGFAIGPAIGSDYRDDIYSGTGQGIYIWGGELVLTSSTSQEFTSLESNYDLPMIDYTIGKPALRSNVYAENWLRYSEDLTNDVWVKNNMNVSESTIISPDNRYFVNTLTALSSNATIRQTQNMSNRICLFAVYLKRKTGTGNINIKAGNVSSSVDLTNEWQRFVVDGPRYSASYTATSGNYVVKTINHPHGLQSQDYFYFRSSDGSLSFSGVRVISVIDDYTFTFTNSTTGTGTAVIHPHTVEIEIETQGDEIYVWGAQSSGTGYSQIDLSQTRYDTLNYAKEYLPTTNSSFSRPNEFLVLNNLYSQNITSSGSGCLYFEMGNFHTMNGFYTGIYVMDIKNELDELIFSLENNASTSDYWRLRYGSSRTLITGANTVGLLEFHKICIKYTSTTVDFFFDGSKVSTYSIPQPAPNLNIETISIRGYQLHKNISVFPILTDTQCENLTAL